jgi:hypothetical protein
MVLKEKRLKAYKAIMANLRKSDRSIGVIEKDDEVMIDYGTGICVIYKDIEATGEKARVDRVYELLKEGWHI